MEIELRKIMPGNTADAVADIIYDNDAGILNTVYELKSQLYGGGEVDIPTGNYEEVIPYNSNTNQSSHTDATIVYQNQGAIQGKHIHSVKLKVTVAGTFTVFMATSTSGAGITWSHQFVIATVGEQELIINRYLPSDQYLGFNQRADSARFGWNANIGPNPVGGGFWYGTTLNPANICIGVKITSSGGASLPQGEIPQLMARVEALETGVPSREIDYIALGDSITFGYGGVIPYPVLLDKRPGIKMIHNLAISGKTVIGVNGLITEIDQVPDSFSGLITLMIGINDWSSTPGDVSTVLSKNFADLNLNASFAEAFRYCLETLLRKVPAAKVLVILPLKSNGREAGAVRIRQIECDICEYFAVPHTGIHLACGISPLTFSSLMPDGLHPNNEGNVRIERALWPVVQNLIS